MASTPSNPTKNNDGWRIRRRYMSGTLVFSMLVIAFCLYRNLDSPVAETAVTMAFVIIGTTISSYVFGAVWQDVKAQDWIAARGASRDPYGYGPTGSYYGGDYGYQPQPLPREEGMVR